MENRWANVGPQVRARRKQLRLTQDQVKQRGGPSTALQRQVESGTYDADMHPAVRRGYEVALDWHLDSIDQVLAGGDPHPAEGVDWSKDVPEPTWGRGGPGDDPSVSAADDDEPEFEWLHRVREDLTAEEWEIMKKESEPWLKMMVRDIKNRQRGEG